ncbi:MAG: FtsX-like permease family protein [Bacteroidales bacterium]|nr:FtsX-like permease family protein [Bacteroidales bacterium]MCF8333349.1 FtsX-like permease family protein [Bacteroidales bacterium]
MKTKTRLKKCLRVINEAMVEYMGWPDNQSAIGKKFHSLRGQERVVGVFKNFNVKSLHSQRKPFVLNMKENDWEIRYFAAWVAVKYLPGSEKEILAFLEEKWKAFAPSRPFDYTFLDQEIDKLYSNEEKVSTLSGILTFLTILIAVLGLFGLVSFMADQRTREIGIRRTLGATLSNIIRIITGEFMWLVLIANFIAWPAAYLVLSNWLKNFAYHTSMNFWVYLLSGSIAAVLTLIITSVKAYNVSRLNPGSVLKYE